MQNSKNSGNVTPTTPTQTPRSMTYGSSRICVSNYSEEKMEKRTSIYSKIEECEIEKKKKKKIKRYYARNLSKTHTLLMGKEQPKDGRQTMKSLHKVNLFLL